MYIKSAERTFCNLKQFRSVSDFHHWYSISPYVLVLSLFLGGGVIVRNQTFRLDFCSFAVMWGVSSEMQIDYNSYVPEFKK